MQKPKGFDGNQYDRYLDYLESDRWAKLRSERLLKDNYRCALCGSPEQLNVHHLFYPIELGTESLNDLITLCRDCHGLIEQIKKEGRYCKKLQVCSFDVIVQIEATNDLEIFDFINGSYLPEGNIQCYFYSNTSNGHSHFICTNMLGVKNIKDYFHENAEVIIGRR